MAFKMKGMGFGEGTGSSPKKQLVDASNLKDKVASVANVKDKLSSVKDKVKSVANVKDKVSGVKDKLKSVKDSKIGGKIQSKMISKGASKAGGKLLRKAGAKGAARLVPGVGYALAAKDAGKFMMEQKAKGYAALDKKSPGTSRRLETGAYGMQAGTEGGKKVRGTFFGSMK